MHKVVVGPLEHQIQKVANDAVLHELLVQVRVVELHQIHQQLQRLQRNETRSAPCHLLTLKRTKPRRARVGGVPSGNTLLCDDATKTDTKSPSRAKMESMTWFSVTVVMMASVLVRW